MKKQEFVCGFPVIRSDRKTVGIQVKPGGVVEIRAPRRLAAFLIERFVWEKEEWIREAVKNSPPPKQELSNEDQKRLKKLAKEVLPPLVEAWASRMGVRPAGIRFTSAKTRYVSCSAKGNLNFSLYLMNSPMEAVEYVVVHELCHLKHMNHSKAFWQAVERCLPDYKERRKKLK